MPNWCYNSTTLYNSDKSKMDAVADILSKEEAQLFNYLRPRPKDQEENWYDWNINNWGTKWDGSIYDWERIDDNTISIHLDTAWGPPIALYEFLVENGWEVESYYHEGGMAFCGKYTTEHGDEYYEYDIRDLEQLQSLPRDVEEFANLIEYHNEMKADGEFDEDEG